MTYVAAEARQELLDRVGDATDQLAEGLAALGAAYDALDERNGDRLEADLFRPLQTAFGRGQRAHVGFAERFALPARVFPTPDAHHGDVRAQLDRALIAIARADVGLSTLQDSMLPVDVGDAELRAGLADVREHLAPLPATARRFLSTLGR